MTLPKFEKTTGYPNEPALFLNCFLSSAVYRNDRAAAEMAAALFGAHVTYFESHQQEFQPDGCILYDGVDYLLVLDGITSAPAWLCHSASAIVPLADPKLNQPLLTRPFVVSSFYQGIEQIEQDLRDRTANPTAIVRVFGHSYGAASAFIFCRHMLNPGHGQRYELMTCGEPKSYDGRGINLVEPSPHIRIIAKPPTVPDQTRETDYDRVDPVVLMPPSFIQWVGRLAPLNFLRHTVAISWTQHGKSWVMGDDYLEPGIEESIFTQIVPFSGYSYLLGNLLFMPYHRMFTSYLPKAIAAWQRSGHALEMTALLPKAREWIDTPFTPFPVLLPSITPATVNSAMFVGSPVTVDNINQFDLISAVGFFPGSLTSARSDNPMSLFKGTMQFNTDQGSFSESVYAKSDLLNSQDMMVKMRKVMAQRCKLSVLADNEGCNNPLRPFGIRVEDTLVLRDAISEDASPTLTGFTGGQRKQDTENQNLDLQLGPRIKYVGGGGRQFATVHHHGMPIYAYNGIIPSGTAQFGSAFRRYPRPNSSWLTELAKYMEVLGTEGLGFRTITGAWNHLVTGKPLAYASPTFWQYNTTAQMVELVWATKGAAGDPPYFPAGLVLQAPANWPDVGAICRLQVRGWKGFQVLNGRWSAEVIVPPGDNLFALRIIRRCRLPLIPINNVPKVSPIAWQIWSPGETTNPRAFGGTLASNRQGAVIAGQWAGIGDKNLGKPFGGSVGRQRNRPT
jgi:hypothetical protein